MMTIEEVRSTLIRYMDEAQTPEVFTQVNDIHRSVGCSP